MRTTRIIGVIGGSLALIVAANAAFAQENRPQTMLRPVARVASTTPVRETLRERAATTTRETLRARIASTTELVRERIRLASTTAANLEAIRQTALDRVAARKQKAEERISKIEDKQKQAVAKRIANQFDGLNEKWTDQFTRELDHDQAVLGRIQERAASSSADVAAVTSAVAAAQSAIDAARAAVAAQAAKTYTLASTTPAAAVTATSTPSGQQALIASLRTQFQTLHTSLFADLMALRDGPITDARKAVQAALDSLRQVPGIDQTPAAAATSTPLNQ